MQGLCRVYAHFRIQSCIRSCYVTGRQDPADGLVMGRIGGGGGHSATYTSMACSCHPSLQIDAGSTRVGAGGGSAAARRTLPLHIFLALDKSKVRPVRPSIVC